MLIFLAELVAYDPNIGRERTLRYASGDGYMTGPADTPPNAYYDARINDPATLRRDIFARGATEGRSQTGYGHLKLLNGDGALDALAGYSFDGRSFRILVGDDEQPYSTFKELIVATMSHCTLTREVVSVVLKDRQLELDVPLQPTKYAGDNALPAGLEGTANDLLGKPKPFCAGKALNVSPPCVNTSRLIYQVHEGVVLRVDAVYDRGVSLTKGSDYASQADMEANAPAAGAFRCWPAGGYFRLGSSPAGLVTADVTEGATAAERTAAQVFSRLVARAIANNAFAPPIGRLGRITISGDTRVTSTGDSRVIGGDVSESDLAAMDAANSAEIGFWTADETTIAAVCDQVAASVGAWWGVDQHGTFRIQRVAELTGSVVATITADDMIQPLQRVETVDQELPVQQTILRYARFWTTQTSDLAGSVSDSRRAQLAQPFREVTAESTDVQQVHLLSRQRVVETLLFSQAAAQSECNRQHELRRQRRERYTLAVKQSDFPSLDLGQEIAIEHPRFGLQHAPPFLIVGIEARAMPVGNTTIDTLYLSIWGGGDAFRARITQDSDNRVTSDGAYRITRRAA